MGRGPRAAGGGERATPADNERRAACGCGPSCEYLPGRGPVHRGGAEPWDARGGAEVAERLTWLATHTHPAAQHFPPPPVTHALTGAGGGLAREELAVHSPAQPPQREGRASFRVNVPPE